MTPRIPGLAVEAVKRAIESEHRYLPVALHPHSEPREVEHRMCTCGSGFLTIEAHRQHVYRAAIEAALPHIITEEQS